MKRRSVFVVFAIVMLFALSLFALTACNNTSETTGDNTQKEQTALKAPEVVIEQDGLARFWWDYAESFVIRLNRNDKEIPIEDKFYQLKDGQCVSVKAISYEPSVPDSEWSDWYTYNASDFDDPSKDDPSDTQYTRFDLSSNYVFGLEDSDGKLHTVYFDRDGKIDIDGNVKEIYIDSYEEKFYEKVGNDYKEIDLNVDVNGGTITFNGTVYRQFVGLFLPTITDRKTYIDVESGDYIYVDGNETTVYGDNAYSLFYYKLGDSDKLYAKDNNAQAAATFVTIDIQDDVVSIDDQTFYEIVYSEIEDLPTTYPSNAWMDGKKEYKADGSNTTGDAYYFSQRQESLCHYYVLWGEEYPSCMALSVDEKYYVALVNQKYYGLRFDSQKCSVLPIAVNENGLTVGDDSYVSFSVMEYNYKEEDGVYKPVENSTGNVVEYFGLYANVTDNQTIGVLTGSLSYNDTTYDLPIKVADSEYIVAYVNLGKLTAKNIEIAKRSDNTFNVAVENKEFYPVIDKVDTSLSGGIYKNTAGVYVALNYNELTECLELSENGSRSQAVIVNNVAYFFVNGTYVPFDCDGSDFDYNGNTYSKINLVESTDTAYSNVGIMQMFSIEKDNDTTRLNTLYIKGASDKSYQMITYNNYGDSSASDIKVFYEENAVTYCDNYVGYRDEYGYHTLRSWKEVENTSDNDASDEYFYVDGIKYQNIPSDKTDDYLTQPSDFGDCRYFVYDSASYYLAVGGYGLVYFVDNSTPDASEQYFYKLDNGYFVSKTGNSFAKYVNGTFEYIDDANNMSRTYDALVEAKSMPQGIDNGDYVLRDRYGASLNLVKIKLDDSGDLNYYEREKDSSGNYAFTKATRLFESASGDKRYYFYEDDEMLGESGTIHRLATVGINEEEKLSARENSALSNVFTDGAGTYFTRGTEIYNRSGLYDTDGTLITTYYYEQGYSEGFVVDENYNAKYFKCVVRANSRFFTYEERAEEILGVYALAMGDFEEYYVEYVDAKGDVRTRRVEDYNLYRKPLRRATDQSVLGYYKEVDENGESSYKSGINVGISKNNNIVVAPNSIGSGATSGYGLMVLALYVDEDGTYYWMLNEKDIEPYASCTIKDGEIVMTFPYAFGSGETNIGGVTYREIARVEDVNTYYKKATAYDASSHNGEYIVKGFSLDGMLMEFIIDGSTLKVKQLQTSGIEVSEYSFYQYGDYIFALANKIEEGNYATLYDNYRFEFAEDGRAFSFIGSEKVEMYKDAGEATADEFNAMLGNKVHRYARLDTKGEYGDIAYMELDGTNGVINFVNYQPEGVSSVNTFRKLSSGEIYFAVGDIKYIVANGTTENSYVFYDRENDEEYEFYRVLPDDGKSWDGTADYIGITDGTYTCTQTIEGKTYTYTYIVGNLTQGEGETATTSRTATLTVSWTETVDGVETSGSDAAIVYRIYKTSYQQSKIADYFLCDANGVPKICLLARPTSNTFEINGNTYTRG